MTVSGSRARLGVQHPDEKFEFARFCLLEHYATNQKFMTELEELATRHRSALESITGAPAAGSLSALSDYRLAWSLPSFMIHRGGGTAETRRITDYREELTTFAEAWGLDAVWCAPSLHVAIVAGIFYSNGRSRIGSLTPFFKRDLERQGRPKQDSMIPAERLWMLGDDSARGINTTLFKSRDGKVLHFDPRSDDWNECLARVRRVIGTKRLGSKQNRELELRRAEIEAAFVSAGYVPRRKGRRLGDEEAIARYAEWTYWAICPPHLTTEEIIRERVDGAGADGKTTDPAAINRGIAKILKMLGLPSRRRGVSAS